MRDKSHEHRKIKDPSSKKSTSDKKKLMKRVFEQIEEAFSELEKEFTNEDKTSNQQKKDKQTNTKRVYQDQNLKRNRKESVPEELERSARQRGRVEEKHVNLPIHARAIETRINFKRIRKTTCRRFI